MPAAGGAPGVKVAAHIPGPAVDPADGPFTVDPALEGEAAGYVRDRLPGLDPAGLAAETCLYTMTTDEDFLLDRAGPLVVGGGCSGHAFKFGPLLGEFLAVLALGPGHPGPAGTVRAAPAVSGRVLTPDDVVAAAVTAEAALRPVADRDRSVRAGPLDWYVEQTITHMMRERAQAGALAGRRPFAARPVRTS